MCEVGGGLTPPPSFKEGAGGWCFGFLRKDGSALSGICGRGLRVPTSNRAGADRPGFQGPVLPRGWQPIVFLAILRMKMVNQPFNSLF